MPHPLYSILLLFALFCLFLAVSFLLSIIYGYKNLKRKDKQTESNETNETALQSEKKIYYIEKYNKPTRKRRKKKPQIALKGTVISPQEFKRLTKDD